MGTNSANKIDIQQLLNKFSKETIQQKIVKKHLNSMLREYRHSFFVILLLFGTVSFSQFKIASCAVECTPPSRDESILTSSVSDLSRSQSSHHSDRSPLITYMKARTKLVSLSF